MLAAIAAASTSRSRPTARCSRKKRRRCSAAGLKRVTVSLDSLDDATFRAMNDVDFPVAQRARRHRRRGRRRSRADQDQHGGQARHERRQRSCRWRATSAAAATSCASSSTWTSAHTNGWRMDDVVPAAEIVARDQRGAAARAMRPELSRRSRRALALSRRQRRDRRDRVGDAGVLPRLHARAAVDRRQALHLPVRHRRARSARAAARRRATMKRSPRRSPRSGASAPTAIRRSAPRKRRALQKSKCAISAGRLGVRLARLKPAPPPT